MIIRDRIFRLQTIFFLGSSCPETHEKHGFNIIGSVWAKFIVTILPFFIINYKSRFSFFSLVTILSRY
jgi:hypothetical protein